MLNVFRSIGGTVKKVFHFYVDGFKSMTLGKTLWTIIIVKLFVMFFILKMFFFPNHVKQNAVNNDKAGYVGKELIERGMATDENDTINTKNIKL